MTIRNSDVGDRPENEGSMTGDYSDVNVDVGSFENLPLDSSSDKQLMDAGIDISNREFFLEDIKDNLMYWVAQINIQDGSEGVDFDFVWRNETSGEKLFEHSESLDDAREGYIWTNYNARSWIDGGAIDKPGIYSVEISADGGLEGSFTQYFRVIRKDPLDVDVVVKEDGKCVKKSVDPRNVPSSSFDSLKECRKTLSDDNFVNSIPSSLPDKTARDIVDSGGNTYLTMVLNSPSSVEAGNSYNLDFRFVAGQNNLKGYADVQVNYSVDFVSDDGSTVLANGIVDVFDGEGFTDLNLNVDIPSSVSNVENGRIVLRSIGSVIGVSSGGCGAAPSCPQLGDKIYPTLDNDDVGYISKSVTVDLSNDKNNKDSPENDNSDNVVAVVYKSGSKDKSNANSIVDELNSNYNINAFVKPVDSVPQFSDKVDGVFIVGGYYTKFDIADKWLSPKDKFDDDEFEKGLITDMISVNGVIYQALGGIGAEGTNQATEKFISSDSIDNFASAVVRGELSNIQKLKNSKLVKISALGIFGGVVLWLLSR